MFVTIKTRRNFTSAVASTAPQPPTKPTHVNEMCAHFESALFTTRMANIKTFLEELKNQAFKTSSYNTIRRTGENKVYGQYYCRGDINSDLCGKCVEEASHSYCVGSSKVVVWYEECTLRYDNRSMVGIVDLDTESDLPYYWFDSSSFNVSDPDKFGVVLNNTMEKIITKAAYGNGSLGYFSTGEGVVSESETVYCLVQCSPDLNANQCNTCLRAAYNYFHTQKLLTLSTEWVGWMSMYFSSCQVRYTNYGAFYPLPKAPPGPSPSPPSPSPQLPTTKGNNASYYVVRAVIPAAVVGLLTILAISFCLIRRKKTTIESGAPETEAQTTECVHFDLKTIESATNGFSMSNKLGQGGFGIVYQGLLNNEQDIAVKRLSKGSRQGTEEFKTEVAVLAKLHHKNLVQLLGCCADGEERLLVFEFLRNLSLDRFLFDENRSAYLTWTIRHKIILGIACGLHYLHEDLRVKIVHRDLKTSNILLDDNLEPKIADFGMARLVKVDETAGNTTKVVGTYGYMSPEYALAGRYSTKSDVYSFGVIVLEILCGKNNNMFYEISQSEGLLPHAWRVWSGGAIEQLMDPVLQTNYSRIEAEKCLQIGLLCVQDDATNRPTLHAVLLMLNSDTVDLPPPSSPSHYNYINKLSQSNETQENTSMQQENESCLSSTTSSDQKDLHAR